MYSGGVASIRHRHAKLSVPNRIFIFITHIEAVVSPAAEFDVAVLVVEGEPCDVYLARGLEDARGDVGARPVACHHYVCRVGPVKSLARTGGF